jgi:transcription initiation factor IIE alpha subunit
MKLKEVKATTAVYQCPMGCEGEKTYTKEGKCPVCNMKLKKVEAKKATKGHEGHKLS